MTLCPDLEDSEPEDIRLAFKGAQLKDGDQTIAAAGIGKSSEDFVVCLGKKKAAAQPAASPAEAAGQAAAPHMSMLVATSQDGEAAFADPIQGKPALPGSPGDPVRYSRRLRFEVFGIEADAFRPPEQKGTYRSTPLPAGGSALDERKRVSSGACRAPRGFFVGQAPAGRGGESSVEAAAASAGGDVSKEVADAVFEEFARWLQDQLGARATEGVAARAVALAAVHEGFCFTMEHKFPPMFPQSRYVLVVGARAQVWVLWLAFVTDKPAPDLKSTPHISLATCDLNTEAAAAEAPQSGLHMDYVVVPTRERDLGRYAQQRQASALSRAAVEGCWGEVLC
ncbi:unnamed protein product [Prorocentrum cordatum]|uniref:Ubiquitin-like domain-containing protein n=1 Tax=Prorocentrum cordatum TaxID=2364126 RepID=A0ABN9TC06_9DINO|nr:unnamed protein product [Polarella glacialis]